MKLINNANITSNALTIRKENHLDIVRKFTFSTIRISAKAIFAAIALTLLNLVI